MYNFIASRRCFLDAAMLEKTIVERKRKNKTSDTSEDKVPFKDTLQLMLEARDEDGSPLSLETLKVLNSDITFSNGWCSC